MNRDRDRIDADQLQREPFWSEAQAASVEDMQPRRSGEEPTSRDTILWLRAENETLRNRLAALEWMRINVLTRVLPALARIHDGKPCPAKHHSPYTRCPECDLREFLDNWREDQQKTEARNEQ